jgi:hypothetical protein
MISGDHLMKEVLARNYEGDFKELMIADDLTRPQPQQLYTVAGLLVFLCK